MINTNKIQETILNELTEIEIEEYQWHEILACMHQLIAKMEYINRTKELIKELMKNEENKQNNNTN